MENEEHKGPPEKGECPSCEDNLKDSLIKVSCSGLSPKEKNKCEELVDEFLKKDEITPDEFVKFMKEKGAWPE